MENNGELLFENDSIFSKGYGFISKMVMQDKRLSISAKGLYAYICSFSGKGNDAFPSRKKICFDLNISNETLGKYLNELKENNYIDSKQTLNNGRFANNQYIIMLKVPIIIQENTMYEIFVHDRLDTNNNIYNNNNNNIKENNIINNIIKENKKNPKKFIKPTLQEVQDYCNERKNKINPEQFIDYYESIGWKVGKNNMKDWKSAIRTWERNNKDNSNTNSNNSSIYPYEYVN